MLCLMMRKAFNEYSAVLFEEGNSIRFHKKMEANNSVKAEYYIP